jgi:hypothetical protein
MPTYRVRDSVSGVTLDLTGESAPTQEQLQGIFAQYRQENSRLTEETIVKNADWIDSSRKVYEMNEGQSAADMSDEDVAKYGLNYMGQFNYNLGVTALEASQVGDASDEQKQAFVKMIDMYDEKAPSLAGFGRFVKGVATDPSTYVALPTLGLGTVAGQAVKQGLKEGVKQSAKAGLKRGMAVGAIEGGVYGALDETLRQTALIEAGGQEDYDFEDISNSASMGVAGGAALGGALSAGGAALLAKKNKAKALADESGKPVERVDMPDTAEIPDTATQKIDSIDVEQADVIDPIKDIAPNAPAEFSEELGRKAVKDMANMPDLTEPKVATDLMENTTKAAGQMLESVGVNTKTNMRISDQIFNLLQTDMLDGKDFYKALKQNNVSTTDFAQAYRVEIRDAAQKLARLSAESKRLNKIFRSYGDDAALLEELVTTPVDNFGDGLTKKLRELDNIRRGMLVSQLATTMRNMTAGYGRAGVDTLTKAMDNTLQQVFSSVIDPITGKKGRVVDWSNTTDLIVNLVAGTKKRKQSLALSEWIEKNYKLQSDRMLTTYSSDVARLDKKGVIGAAQKAVDTLNYFNKETEFYFRRAAFSARLTETLARRGVSIDDIVARNDLTAIKQDEIEDAVNFGLEFTYAKEPEFGTVTHHLIEVINKLPFIATSVIPFPRFMANAIKYQFEVSPLGFARFLDGEQRKALAKGDTKATRDFGKAVVGSALLMAAFQFRNSEYAGELWYQAKGPDDTRLDMRPYFPLTPYIFVADIIKRTIEGTALPDAQGFLQGLTGAQFRAGTSSSLVNGLLNALEGETNDDKIKKIVSRWAADTIGGYLTPFRMFKDFVQEEQTYRTPKVTGDFLTDTMSEIARNLPFAQESLGAPESYSPTRADPMRRVAPALRQITGVTATEAPNAAEKEFNRLGITRREIVGYSGDRNLDQLVNKYLGPLVEQVVGREVQTEGYKSLSNKGKRAYLDKVVMPKVRAEARRLAKEEDPMLFLKQRYRKQRRSERLYQEELFGGPPPMLEE